MPAKRNVHVDHAWVDRSSVKSNHGAQRGDSIALAIRWSCDVNPAEFTARFGVSYTAKGKGRGRGLRLIDASRQRDGRTDGTDWLSIKGPRRRINAKTGKPEGWTTSHELFTGLPETWETLAEALRVARADEKKIGVLIVHCENTGDEDADTFDPIPVEVGSADLARMYVEACRAGLDKSHTYWRDWADENGNPRTFAGLPIKPEGYRKGAAGNPCGMWITEDASTGYVTVSFSMAKAGANMRPCKGWDEVAAAADEAVAPRKR